MNIFKKIINLLALIAETNIIIFTNQMAENGHLEDGKQTIHSLKNRLIEIMK